MIQDIFTKPKEERQKEIYFKHYTKLNIRKHHILLSNNNKLRMSNLFQLEIQYINQHLG